jgi:hypothetical protein
MAGLPGAIPSQLMTAGSVPTWSAMERNEAHELLRQQLDRHRTRSHRELQSLIAEPEVIELVGPSGTRFCIEVLAVWDSQVGGDIRVIGSIDDGGWRAFKPLTDDFIMRPDGTLVEE